MPRDDRSDACEKPSEPPRTRAIVPVPFPRADFAEIETAAGLLGFPLTEFIRRAAVEKARAVRQAR